jgi:ADP-ribose pyrophosphatase
VSFFEVSREVRDHGDGMRIGEVVLVGPDGGRFRRRYLHTPDVVAVVATYQDQLVLVREFRAALGTEVLQVPMGKLPYDVDPDVQAATELREETGFEAARCEPIGSLLSCPGWLNQRMYVCRADDLRPLANRAATGDDPDDVEERYSEVVLLPRADFNAAVRAGTVSDARTIAALYMAEVVE